MEPQSTLSTWQETSAPPTPGGFGWRAALLIAALGITFALGGWFGRHNMQVPANNSVATPAANAEKPVVVDVGGAVKHPGVYELPFNSRIYQAIDKAGGALPNADLETINQAAWIEDGSQLEVPSKKQNIKTQNPTLPMEIPSSAMPSAMPPVKSTFIENSISTPANHSAQKPTAHRAAKSTLKSAPQSSIDLNHANAIELQQLPGVGPAMAERILQYRKQIQGFTSVDDLSGVRGIGPKKLEKILPFVMVKPLPHQLKKENLMQTRAWEKREDAKAVEDTAPTN